MLKRVLVIKHDKIGDFVLMWPALYLLRHALPQASIEMFVSPAVKPFAEVCPYVDHVIVDNGNDEEIGEAISARQYDAILISQSEYRIYKILRHIDVAYKLAPKHNWYQYLYKHRANVQYRKGEPCWRGACLLVEHFLNHFGYSIPALPKQYWDKQAVRDKWQDYYEHSAGEKLIFAHPGTGGSSGALAPKDFAYLLTQINANTKIDCKFVLTFNGDEEALAQIINKDLQANGVKVVMAKPLAGLADFAESLVAADMFIAGSTGPLHIAGLHDVPTVGFYAGRRSAPKIRWQTLTQSHKRLAFTPPIGKKTGRNMALIDFDAAAQEIAQFLDTFYGEPQPLTSDL